MNSLWLVVCKLWFVAVNHFQGWISLCHLNLVLTMLCHSENAILCCKYLSILIYIVNFEVNGGWHLEGEVKREGSAQHLGCA